MSIRTCREKTLPVMPCHVGDPDLWFAESPVDLERAKAVARRVRTGTLGLNGGIWYGADAPFGGYKQSGIGRQCGMEGLEIFTETKTVGWPA